MSLHRGTALVAAIVMSSGCIGAVMPPPTAGYGAPYKGTGEGIYVKDSRGDWDITEGHHKISSEHALEATGDAEYEARRQVAADYNVRLYREGEEHRSRGTWMIRGGIAAAVAGAVLAFLVAPNVQSVATTPATATMPEMRTYSTGVATSASLTGGYALIALGLTGIVYGFIGGRKPPPYHVWHTPGPLNRPAYVRQQTEPYNEKLGVDTVPDEDGAQKDTAKLPVKHKRGRS